MAFNFFDIGKIIGEVKISLGINARTEINIAEKKIEAQQVTEVDRQFVLQQNTTYNIGNLGQLNTKALSDSNNLLGVSEAGNLLSSPAPAEAVGAVLPAGEGVEGDKYTESLDELVKLNNDNPEFLLDKGRLCFFYEKRELIAFTEEQLVFLLRSSLKSDFPFWYWCLIYRESIGNVSGLLEKVYVSSDRKVKTGVIRIFGKFADISDELFVLGERETYEDLLGRMVVVLKSKDNEASQRLIANALSRRRIPKIEYADIKDLSAELSRREKAFLHQKIKEGWPSEKIFSLNILSLTADEFDLPLVEGVIENSQYTDLFLSALHCLARIGKTTKSEFLNNALEETRREEAFLQLIETLGAIKDKPSFPSLLKWYKNQNTLASRFDELNTWKTSRVLEAALMNILDEETYEIVIQDILAQEFYGENWGLFTWRLRHLLRDVRNERVRNLVRTESRLNALPEWGEVLKEEPAETMKLESHVAALENAIDSADFRKSLFAARRLWEVIPSANVLSCLPRITALRENLASRLLASQSDPDFSKEEKEITKNPLDAFLGENTYVLEIDRGNKDKGGFFSRHRGKDEETTKYSKLREDVRNFELIESEFIKTVLKEKTVAVKEYLFSQIGRPYQEIYDSISLNLSDIDTEAFSTALEEFSSNCTNPILVMRAFGARNRIGKLEKMLYRAYLLKRASEASAAVKKIGSRAEGGWFGAELTCSTAYNLLSEIGDPRDIPLVMEWLERDERVFRYYSQLSEFHSMEAMKKLLEIAETTEDEKERENVYMTLERLDSDWTGEILSLADN